MKFTIFTPFYEYIECAEHIYESLLKQTYIHWEWLILDDFSENPEVLSKLKYLESLDDRVKVIYPKWKKQYFYNLPIEHSSGDIILKQDSDDVPSPKLLEVYKYIYEKFTDDLVSVGSSSLVVKDDFKGSVIGAKYINYKNSSNYLEGIKNNVMSVIGDARSYKISKLKNNGIFISHDEPKFIFGEDYVKTICVEEFGKIIVPPRILHRYSNRRNSNSGGGSLEKIPDEDLRLNRSILDYYTEKSNKRVDRKNLVSIENYYDDSFIHFKNFFFCSIEDELERNNIEYWSNSISARDIQKIKDLYFDHNIFINEKISSPKFIVIDGDTDENIISKVLSERNFKNCIITITSESDKYEHNREVLKSLGFHHYWFNIHLYSTIKIRT